MIARLWHGRTRVEQAGAYLDFLKERAIPDYESVPGNRGVYLLHEIRDDAAHFITLTFWDSREAIAAFAGEDISRAKYYSEDTNFLLEFEPTVQHYEVYPEALPTGGAD
jgi:heme-degrading monooxygenase HmoA